MTEFFTNHEVTIRLVSFAGIFGIMAVAEIAAPKRRLVLGRGHRWLTNLLIVVTDTVLLRIVMPLFAVGMAVLAAERGWGLLNLWQGPELLKWLVALIALDMLIYWQHVASHYFSPLWALHKMHHTDRDIDVTTALRFHPLEIILSMAFKLLCVLALGAPVGAVILFEVVLNGSAMFNHANLRLPRSVDRVLRWFIVTPDMHRVHHSVDAPETNSNYGFNLSVWDRVFGTYRDQPQKGHDAMTIGLPEYQSEKPASFWWSLTLPFRSTTKNSEQVSSS